MFEIPTLPAVVGALIGAVVAFGLAYFFIMKINFPTSGVITVLTIVLINNIIYEIRKRKIKR